MKLRHLELHRFTAFETAKFEFTPGVNVLIGENGTGKSHVLKLIYVTLFLRGSCSTTYGAEPSEP